MPNTRSPEVAAVMAELQAHCDPETPSFAGGVGAPNLAGLWALVQKYGPTLIQTILTLIQAQSPGPVDPAKVKPVVLATIESMEAQGLISRAA